MLLDPATDIEPPNDYSGDQSLFKSMSTTPQAKERLQPLSLSPLEPHHVSRRGLAVSELSKIGAVRVARQRDVDKGVTEYAVSVRAAETSTSHLPTTTNKARRERLSSFWGVMCAAVDVSSNSSTVIDSSSSSFSQPAESIELDEPEMLSATKRLADFAALRDKVYSLAMTAHNFEVCEFCEHALHFALWGGTENFQQQRNALALLILDENKLLETLAALVRDLVALCASSSGSGRGGRVLCRAENQLPLVVNSFLFGGSL
jgi:hypothetical protein